MLLINELDTGTDLLVGVFRSFRPRKCQVDRSKERERENSTGRKQARISRGFILQICYRN